MKIVKAGEVEPKLSKNITGLGELTNILPPQLAGGIKFSLVHFSDGARTQWHEHPGEQILYILEGDGRVGTEANEWNVGPGDLVYALPCEKHWHGAAPGKSMIHISITNTGDPSWYDAVK